MSSSTASSSTASSSTASFSTAPSQTDAAGVDPGIAYQFAADAYHHLVQTLCLALPPPPKLDPGPEDFARRDHAAIARIAALTPANAAEAALAAQFVAASEQGTACLRLAERPETLEWAAKCRAQALSMMRQSQGALRLLLRMQDIRRKLERDNAACDRAAWTEHCALGLMAAALASSAATPAREPAPAEAANTGVAEPAAPPPAPEPPAAALSHHAIPSLADQANETTMRTPVRMSPARIAGQHRAA